MGCLKFNQVSNFNKINNLLDIMVPLAGLEPALLAELDFESSASTNSATGARRLGPKTPGPAAGL